MEFFARLSLRGDGGGSPLRIVTGDRLPDENDVIRFTGSDVSSLQEVHFPGGAATFCGDPIFHDPDHNEVKQLLSRQAIGQVIRKVDGFYFLIALYDKDQRVIITSSLFSILPVYYFKSRKELVISSSFDLLLKSAGNENRSLDKQYYLEKALFNYPLFDRTPVSGINTLPSNSLMEYKDKAFVIKQHTFFSELFISDPEPWKKATERLAELFINCASDFIPAQKAVVTLTGGFDSRTVLGVALSRNGVSQTYSYGSPGEGDIVTASAISQKLGIRYTPVILDEEYSVKEFWRGALSFVRTSHGLGNLSRAHYCYALDTGLKDARYLLSGNFGSELLRSMKVPGVVTSGSLFDMFRYETPEEITSALLLNPALNYLNRDLINETIISLVNEIIIYKDSLPGRLTMNQRFYSYLFGEVFRKYFGPEIMVQRHRLKHRAPFLCYSFIEAILLTGLAGANSRFLESNPLKRYQGQMLYATILKKISPWLNSFELDRGYRPADLLSPFGMARVISSYMAGKILKKKASPAPDHLWISLRANINDLRNIEIEESLFDRSFIMHLLSGSWENDQVNFNNMMSAVLYNQFITNGD